MSFAIRPPLERQRFLAEIRGEPDFDALIAGGDDVAAPRPCAEVTRTHSPEPRAEPAYANLFAFHRHSLAVLRGSWPSRRALERRLETLHAS